MTERVPSRTFPLHTHFDNVESFLYVLLLLFFSYVGPLPRTELENAHEKGFVRPIRSGRLFPYEELAQKVC